MANRFGIDEFADGLGDIVHLMDDDGIRSALKKGERIELLKLLLETAENYPTIKELVDDWPVFRREAADLSLEEKDVVLERIKARFPNPDDLQAKIIEAYETIGFGYQYIAGMVLGGGKEFVERVKLLIDRDQEV